MQRAKNSRAVGIIGMAVAWFYLFPRGPEITAAWIDPSWQAALNMASHDGLEQGTEIVYTYGPLGYLATPVYVYTPQWQISTIAGFSSTLALVAVVYWLFRASQPCGLSGILTAVVLSTALHFSDGTGATIWLLTAALAGLGIVVQEIRVRTPVVLAFGALASVLALASPVAASGAAVALGGSASISAYLDRGLRGAGRIALMFLGSTIATLIALWMLLGQPLENLDEWARYAPEVTSGYAASMGTLAGWLSPGDLVAALALVGLVVAAVWRVKDRVTRRTRLGAIVLFLALAYLELRHAFVRSDYVHIRGFFEFAALAPIAFLPWLKTRTTATLFAIALLPLVASQLIHFGVFTQDKMNATIEEEVESLRPGPRMVDLADTAVAFVSSERRRELEREGVDNVISTANFPMALVAEFNNETVHVSPWETSLPYALPGTTWRPAPVFQDYVAYTTGLDELNADFISGDEAPDIILRKPGAAIDWRMPRWEPPSATLALLCHYRQDDAQGAWIVLRRTPTPRCGVLESLGTETVEYGAIFSTPEANADSILVARFSGIADGTLERLRAAAFKAPEIYVEEVNGRPWRFLQASQESWHIIDAPSCVLDVLDGKKHHPDLSTLRFTNKKDLRRALVRPLTTPDITVEYASVPFSC